MVDSKNKTYDEKRVRDEIMQRTQELHDKIFAIDPKLIVKVTFGDRQVAAGISGAVDVANLARDASRDFRNSWSGGGHFGDGFLKDGDGFANVSFLK